MGSLFQDFPHPVGQGNATAGWKKMEHRKRRAMHSFGNDVTQLCDGFVLDIYVGPQRPSRACVVPDPSLK